MFGERQHPSSDELGQIFVEKALSVVKGENTQKMFHNEFRDSLAFPLFPCQTKSMITDTVMGHKLKVSKFLGQHSLILTHTLCVSMLRGHTEVKKVY